MIKRSQTTHIIIHTAAASHNDEAVDQSAENIRNYHVNKLGWSDIGYHYIIRFDGTIEKGRDEQLQGAHCKDMNMNERSVGVCCSGHGDIKPLTDTQKEAVKRLVNDIRQKYDIPISNVLGHCETGSNKTCPGILVDMNDIRGFLAGESDIEQAEAPNEVDSDGKPDFTEGVSYDQALEMARGAKYESLDELQEARNQLSFWDKVKLTWKGQTQVGRIAGTVLDISELFAPSWTVKIRDSLQPKTTDSTMEDILKRVFTQANGGFWRLWDELEGRDWRYYIAFILRIAIIFGILYGADYLGLPIDKVITAIFGA